GTSARSSGAGWAASAAWSCSSSRTAPIERSASAACRRRRTNRPTPSTSGRNAGTSTRTRGPPRRRSDRPPRPHPYTRSVPLISIRGLTKRYGTSVTALDALTVDIEPGIVGLVGSNGAGKSTLIKILLGLLAPTSGEATVFDLDVRTRGTDIRQLVGYMPEHDCLPPDTTATDWV